MKNIRSCQWLKETLTDVHILDAGIVSPSEQGEYAPAAIIKGAKRFDIKGDFSDATSHLPSTMCSAEQFQAQVRKLGINNLDTVVVYDNKGLFSAARVWWMFKSMSFERVYILDGGLVRWLALGLPTQDTYSESEVKGDFIAYPKRGYFVDKHQVLEEIHNPNSLLLDARSYKRFTGEEPEPRAGMCSGHIPHSKSLHYASLLDEQKCVRPIAELQKKLALLGAKGKSLQFSCGSGITACMLALVADECGYTRLSVYDGSWSEWGNSDNNLPITTGEL